MMTDKKVEYEMSLKDLLTGKVKNADQAVNTLEHSMGSLGTTAKRTGMEMLGALGIGFAAFEGVEFIKHSVEEFHKLEQANAQVKAGLESTGFVAGLTFEDLEKKAGDFAHQFKADDSEIMDMFSQLLTFPGITKNIFGDASQAILDMSTRLHKGLDETAIMVGKALQDPERGITALRRVGVNFNETQTEVIKKLVETGHVAQAQSLILRELQTEFAGSAKAAADADPLFRYHKIMEDIYLEVGKLATELLTALLPVIEYVAHAFKASIEWIREHKDLLISIGHGALFVAKALGVLYIATKIYQAALVVQYLWMMRAVVAEALMASAKLTLAGATGILTGAVEALNIAWKANPIGFVISALFIVGSAVIYAYNHFAKFRAVLLGVWETVKEFGRIVADIFQGLWHVIHGIFTFSPDEVGKGLMQQADAVFNAGQRIGGAFKKGFDQGMEDFAKDHPAETVAGPQTITKKGLGAVGAAGKDAKAETAKATGQKNTTINIHIGDLIKTVNISSKNMVEGAQKLKERVTEALLSAVNDSQIVAGE